MKQKMVLGQVIFAITIGGAVGWFFGGLDGFMYAMVAFVLVDYITGVIAAAINKELSSDVGFKGICKKVMEFLLVGIANVLDMQILKQGAVMRDIVIFFYVANEGLSILENATRIGIPVPEPLKKMLKQLKDKGDGKDEQGSD